MEKFIKKINPVERYRERSLQNERQQTHRSLVRLFTSREVILTELDPSYKSTDDLFQGRPAWITWTIDMTCNKDEMKKYYNVEATDMTKHYDPQTARDVQIEALAEANRVWSEAYRISENRIQRITLWNGKKITGQLLEGLQNPPKEQV